MLCALGANPSGRTCTRFCQRKAVILLFAIRRLATVVPPSDKFTPQHSTLPSPSLPPAKRLVLVSSRVHDCNEVTRLAEAP